MKYRIEKGKAQLLAKVEHPLRVIKRQFLLRQGPFSWPDEEYGATGDAVRPVEHVDGAKTSACGRTGRP